MTYLSKLRRGFTLIEMMIVVAIIGILAAIAIPAFTKNVRQSKASESGINLKAIADGAAAYYQAEHYDRANGRPVTFKQFPGTNTQVKVPAGNVPPQGTKVDIVATVSNDPLWKALKFAPSKPVYYQYGYVSLGTNDGASFSAQAQGDLDGDNITSSYVTYGTITNGNPRITAPFTTNPGTQYE